MYKFLECVNDNNNVYVIQAYTGIIMDKIKSKW